MLVSKRFLTLFIVATALVTQPVWPFANGGASLSSVVMMKAEADECYNGVGGAYVDKLPGVFQAPPGPSSFAPDGPFPSSPPFTGFVGPGGSPVAAGDYILACEGAKSQYLYEQFPRVQPLITRLTGSIFGIIGDWRPPEVWVHDTNIDGPNQLRIPIDDPRIHSTLGLRAAGALDGVVLMAGPGILGLGLQVFAFDADTLELIDARTFARYSNARRFVVLRNHLYVGVQNTDGTGAVLRWSGNREKPIRFQTVGSFETEVAQLATFNNRLVATTWPPSQLSSVAGFLSGGDIAAPSLWITPARQSSACARGTPTGGQRSGTTRNTSRLRSSGDTLASAIWRSLATVSTSAACIRPAPVPSASIRNTTTWT